MPLSRPGSLQTRFLGGGEAAKCEEAAGGAVAGGSVGGTGGGVPGGARGTGGGARRCRGSCIRNNSGSGGIGRLSKDRAEVGAATLVVGGSRTSARATTGSPTTLQRAPG